MDLLHGNIKNIYLRYLATAFGSSLIASIYGIVDMAMVGQYHGPEGTAALAVVAPIWNVIYSLGLLTGIGGSVLMSTMRGRGPGQEKKSNEYFTVSIILTAILSVVVWLAIFLLDEPILFLCGAEEDTLPLALNYLKAIKIVFPLFMINQMLAAYLRNDKAPGLATAGVLSGGIFNMFGDYFFVFVCDMGATGAGIATALGAVVTFVVQIPHFFSRKNTLYLVRPTALLKKSKDICVTGFSTFFIDVAMGILTILFNNQITTYLGTNALAVYGVVVNISTFVQCCAYSVGQAAQPIISTNLGAGQSSRIRQTLKYALVSVAFFSIFWTVICFLFPNVFIRIFMTPTEEVLEIAPLIFRRYALSFLLLPLNIFSTYYFQALMKPGAAFIVSVGRGLVVSGILIYLLPALFAPNTIWFAMPITEVIIAVYVVYFMRKYTKALPAEQEA